MCLQRTNLDILVIRFDSNMDKDLDPYMMEDSLFYEDYTLLDIVSK